MQKNPFDIPGMGLGQDNPLFTSMNMMHQMWERMAANPLGLSNPSAAIPSAEDLDKRIKELRAVENWLQLNLSMLSSTIQGLEIQRSTLATLKSFAEGGLAAMPGLAEAMTQATMSSFGQSSSAADTASASAKAASASTDTPEAADPSNDILVKAGQAWWDMMQQQFETLTQATAQSMQQAQNVAENLSATMPTPSADTTLGKKTTAAKKAVKRSTKTTSTAKKATKAAAKKAVAKKAAKKTSTPKE